MDKRLGRRKEGDTVNRNRVEQHGRHVRADMLRLSRSAHARANAWGVLPLISLLLAFALLGCVHKGYRAYLKEHETVRRYKPKPEDIEFYFSTLDSVRPYVHLFPTGIATEAPNLDPRDFVPPDLLIQRFVKYEKSNTERDSLLGLPPRVYEIIGEVEADIWMPEGVRPVVLEEEGPQKRDWVDLPKADWRAAFNDLRRSGGFIGADAIIEVFCGKGVCSVFQTEQVYPQFIPIVGPDGRIRHYFVLLTSTPSEIRTRDWKLMGLAVRWRD